MLLLVLCVFIFGWFCSAFIQWFRLQNISAGIYSLPAIPFIGHFHWLPKDRYEWPNFLIDHANCALRNGHKLIRWWIFHRICIWALDAETTKAILENSVELRKGRDYAFFGQWLGQGLLLSDGEKWRRQRRMLTHTFHFTMLEQYTQIFNRNAKILINGLSEHADNNGPSAAAGDDTDNQPQQKDIGPLLIRCSLDIVAEAIMGVRLDSAKTECREYAQGVKDFNDLAHIYTTSALFTFIPISWHLFGHSKETKKCVAKLKQFTRRVIEERIKIRAAENGQNETAGHSSKRGKAFLDLLLEMEHSLDREELREQVDTFMFEGHDTSAHGLIWSLWCLATHPNCQQQLHEEIVQHFGAATNENAKFATGKLSMSEVNELRYMDRCVKEALRLFPPVPVVERDLVNDVPIGGRVAPRGTMMLVSPLIMHHNEQVYPRHWDFNPDHFLPDAIAARNPFDYIPFSAGPRNCIGSQRFAVLELKILLAHIFWQFRLSTDVPFGHNRPALEAILRPELGLPVRIHKFC